MKKSLLLIALVCCAGYCPAERRVSFELNTTEARTLDVTPTAYVQPLVAKLEVNTTTGRIHDSWQLNRAEFLAREYPGNIDLTIGNLRAYGLFKSMEKHNCDLIVAPNFDISITESGATINIMGYTANFSKWSTGTKSDYEWIKLDKGITSGTVDFTTELEDLSGSTSQGQAVNSTSKVAASKSKGQKR